VTHLFSKVLTHSVRNCMSGPQYEGSHTYHVLFPLISKCIHVQKVTFKTSHRFISRAFH